MSLSLNSQRRTEPGSGGRIIRTFDPGDGKEIQAIVLADASGNPIGFKGAPASVSLSTTTSNFVTGGSAVSNAVISASPVVLREIECILETTETSETLTFMLFNSTTVPTDGTAPFRRYPIPGTGMISHVFEYGLNLTTGLSVAVSTTRNTKTLASVQAYFQGLTE